MLAMVFSCSIFGVSSGYLRDKAKGKFMYQKNDRFGDTLRVQRYKIYSIYANKNRFESDFFSGGVKV